ncbi:hypothetical protein KDA14_00080 [Candidatus Saccharibacteria bacterium]|nr:hypothetical protein [Candidatus Saccharibacteria bacterium]
MSGKKKAGDVSQASGSASAAPAQVVVSKSNSVWDKLPTGGKNKTLLWLVGSFVIVALVGAAYWYVTGGENEAAVDDESSYQMSNKDYANVHASAMRQWNLGNNPTKDELSRYYDELVTTELQAENYQGVVDAYNEYKKASNGADFTYGGYASTARAYIKLGDKSTALKVIDTGEAALKRTTADQDLLNDFLDGFSTIRQEAQA